MFGRALRLTSPLEAVAWTVRLPPKRHDGVHRDSLKPREHSPQAVPGNTQGVGAQLLGGLLHHPVGHDRNGKSAISAGRALGALLGVWDRQPRREVVVAARSRDRAAIAWSVAWGFVRTLPEGLRAQIIPRRTRALRPSILPLARVQHRNAAAVHADGAARCPDARMHDVAALPQQTEVHVRGPTPFGLRRWKLLTLLPRSTALGGIRSRWRPSEWSGPTQGGAAPDQARSMIV